MPNFAGMNMVRIVKGTLAVILAGGLAFFAGCGKRAPAAPSAASGAIGFWEPHEANPRLPTVKLYLGPEQMDAEMCVTPHETETGMMFRKTMGENDGMIFSLGYDQQASFWMKNCFIPLSVAYISSDGVIREIHPLQPQDTNLVISATNNVRFALETPQGWFDKHHITTGMVVTTERGSLMQTFGQH